MAKTTEKRRKFNAEFSKARADFEKNPTEKNYTFISRVDNGKKTVLKAGETKQSLMKKFKAKPAASAKPTDSTPGYIKRKKTGTRIVKDTKLADVTKKELKDWKEKNEGKYTGKALTAYLNNKGRNISGASKSGVGLESFVKSNGTTKRKVITTTKRIISNAAVRKFMRKEFPRLSNIEIGDTVFFRTNAAGDPVVFSVIKKGK